MTPARHLRCGVVPAQQGACQPRALSCQKTVRAAGGRGFGDRGCRHVWPQEFGRLASAMVENRASEPGPRPPNMIDAQWSFLGPVVLDSVPGGAHARACMSCKPSYKQCVCTRAADAGQVNTAGLCHVRRSRMLPPLSRIPAELLRCLDP